MKDNIMDRITNVLKWQCPVCKKEFHSLYENQIKNYEEMHMKTHEVKQ